MNVPVKQEGISYKNVPMASHGGGGMLMPQTFGEVVAFSEIMARSQHAIPKHLRDVPGACLAVAMQAMRWEMDPFAVASKSYNVKDIIAYEAQLIAAVVHTRAPIKTRPDYVYTGEGQDRRCTVSCLFDDGVTRSYESPRLADITVKNSPLWKADVDQQLGYYSIRAFARRYCPEVILGVYTPEEADTFRGPDNARDVTPRQSLSERLANSTVGAGEGFSQSHVISEIGHTETGAQREAGNNPSPPASTADEALASDQGTAAAVPVEVQDRSESTSSPNSDSTEQPQPPQSDVRSDTPAAEDSPLPDAAGNLSESSGPNPTDDEVQAGAAPGAGLPSTLPEGWAITYAAALRRAQKKESLAKYATDYWKQYGGWDKHKASPDAATAAAIFNTFRDNFGNKEQIELLLRELV